VIPVVNQTLSSLNLNVFIITETELNFIAALAIIAGGGKPEIGNITPEAMARRRSCKQTRKSKFCLIFRIVARLEFLAFRIPLRSGFSGGKPVATLNCTRLECRSFVTMLSGRRSRRADHSATWSVCDSI